MKTITLAFTGASGLPYGLRTLECLLAAGCTVHVLYTQAAQIVAKQELGQTWPGRADDLARQFRSQYAVGEDRLKVWGQQEWFAPMASGSNPGDGMVVVPCTMGALAAIANGASDNLLERAADVMIKERKTLVVVPREAPFSVIHLENMLRLARLGVVILPPNPGFYHHPKDIGDLVDFVVARILDQLGVPHQLMQRWGD
ncbi:flavin prenyltransferase UbiX [Jeongeupia naejangsanensis]|uniref:Flavin prenyltransferase UbiX n=1 Tax=Jeongeupia naejangsanensis TaxID=613195 RepID=A0ABS2BLM5_9NEIS|nr:flavin prenyltransferase UbiX [Jeongeupia naejangsanensis]MBM3115988.1 UbiX family flavin prenyltransferase [Jeongeupia naejangsanensis]